MITITPIAIVAWWGAVLSTIVFCWDIYKYSHAGPRLRFKVQTGMEAINVPQFEGKTLVTFDAINFGDRSTTLTNVTLEYYEKRRLWKKIPDKAAVVITPSVFQPIPYELKAGTRWSGMMVQTEEFERWAKKRLFVLLHHSHSEKPIRKRVILREGKVKSGGATRS